MIKDKEWFTKQYTENYRKSNMNLTKTVTLEV